MMRALWTAATGMTGQQTNVDVIANTIVKGQKDDKAGSQADPYWDDMAEMLLKALIYYLLATRPEEEQNLASCAELVRAANSNGDSNMLTEMMSELPYDHPARMNYKSVELASDKTFSSILSTLQSKLGKFDSEEIADVTSTDTIGDSELIEDQYKDYTTIVNHPWLVEKFNGHKMADLVASYNPDEVDNIIGATFTAKAIKSHISAIVAWHDRANG